jgi:hypothetical protein
MSSGLVSSARHATCIRSLAQVHTGTLTILTSVWFCYFLRLVHILPGSTP